MPSGPTVDGEQELKLSHNAVDAPMFRLGAPIAQRLVAAVRRNALRSASLSSSAAVVAGAPNAALAPRPWWLTHRATVAHALNSFAALSHVRRQARAFAAAAAASGANVPEAKITDDEQRMRDGAHFNHVGQ